MSEARTNHPSRREFMRHVLGAGAGLPLAWVLRVLALPQQPELSSPLNLPQFSLSPEDDQFLNDVENASFLFFWEQASPKTGMVKDRCNVQTNDQGIVASIA